MYKSEENKWNVSIDDVHSIAPVQYTDGDIVFIDDMKILPDSLSGTTINNVEMIVFVACTGGKIKMNINSKPVTLHQAEVLCCSPDSMMDDFMVSPDFGCKVVCISTRIVLNLVNSDKNILNHYFSLRQQPVVYLGKSGLRLFEHYYSLMKFRTGLRGRTYDREVMSALVSAALYDLIGEKGEPEVRLGTSGEMITQGDLLYRRFVELLAGTYPRPRSVVWYGRQLCVTPKYLSTAVRRASGQTALKWITGYVVEDIRRLLAHSDLTVKEVADELGFPSLSFFGKYVRQNLGVSPTEYRRCNS